MKILILGANGMLGSTLFKYFSQSKQHEVVGIVRSKIPKNLAKHFDQGSVIVESNVLDSISLAKIMANTKPSIVINCIGVIKQLSIADDPLVCIPINSIFPHKLKQLCALAKARLIHISTDCVFTGEKGNYKETDFPDAQDLYGRSKLLGEIHDENTITLRTSIIGQELNSSRSLLNWFLSQKFQVKGFTKAIFSGLPANELARVIDEYVLPNRSLHGLYHVSVAPITKFDLLNIINETYQKGIDIVADEGIDIDRSLNSECFQKKTGYKPPSWKDLIVSMHQS